MKRIWSSVRVILLISIFPAVVCAVWGILVDNTITPDSGLQYSGAIIGGIATMLGVFVTIDEDRKRQKVVDRPQITLSLSDYEYENGKYGVYFSPVYQDGRYVADPDRLIPLRITNTGTSRAVIETVHFILDENCEQYISKGHVTFPITFGSTEAIDIPIKVDLKGHTSFLVKITYQDAPREEAYSKTYNVYVPKNHAKRINITLAADSDETITDTQKSDAATAIRKK